MATSHYDWEHGPAEIQQHTIAKHNILRSYLAAYFSTLVSSPNQDVLRLTLVDGFSGGGLYVHGDTKALTLGSPFIFLEATKEAEFLINKDRRKPVRLEVDYFFVEADHNAYAHLEDTLRDRGFGSRIGLDIQLRNKAFHEVAGEITAFIKKKSPRNGRSIFALDQYGYKDVPTTLIRNIFAALPSAEVILTFGVDSLINYASDKAPTRKLLDRIGLGDITSGQSIDVLKQSDRQWRLAIQANLYRALVEQCGAKHFTPFFIRNNKGHGDYWLIHLSQHHRARDVMTEVHWNNSNHFIHYGGPGLEMFQMVGYDPNRDSSFKGQSELGFEFDDIARNASIDALVEQIPRHVYANEGGISFGELFATTCNGTPASGEIYRSAIKILLDHRALKVIAVDGGQRHSAQRIHDKDQIRPPNQQVLFLPP